MKELIKRKIEIRKSKKNLITEKRISKTLNQTSHQNKPKLKKTVLKQQKEMKIKKSSIKITVNLKSELISIMSNKLSQDKQFNGKNKKINNF